MTTFSKLFNFILKMKELLIVCVLFLFLFNYGNSEALFGVNRNNGMHNERFANFILFLIS